MRSHCSSVSRIIRHLYRIDSDSWICAKKPRLSRGFSSNKGESSHLVVTATGRETYDARLRHSRQFETYAFGGGSLCASSGGHHSQKACSASHRSLSSWSR